MCTDSRATAGNWIASQTVKKVIPVSRLSRGEDKPTNDPTPGLLGTMAGGAAVGFLEQGGWKEVGLMVRLVLTRCIVRIANIGCGI